MYLSRIELDTDRRETMIALSAPNRFHGAVEHSFPGDRARNLWRIDRLNDRTYLLLLSRDKPDLESAARQFGYGIYETKNYDRLLERITDGSRWHFRLTANPTFSKSQGQGCTEKHVRGVVIGCGTPEYQAEWLRRRSEKCGFHVRKADEAYGSDDFTITKSRYLTFRKGTDNGRTVKILSVTFEGELTVTETESFKAALCDGIGRGKAYGQGLMTIIRVGEQNG